MRTGRHLAAAIAALCLLVAGCGGGGHHATRPVRLAPGPVQTASPCQSRQSTAAICILRRQPPPAPNLGAPLRAPFHAEGLDGWGPPALSDLGSRQFGVAYFSFTPSKNWTRAAADAYTRAGKAHVGIWETYATRAAGSFADGASDAVNARAQAAAVGDSTGPIVFAIDFQASPGQTASYFAGVHSVLGARDQAYGGYDQVLDLWRRHLVGNQNWQTYAWSGGRWLPSSIAPLEQYLNGNTYDLDRALEPRYGQWPQPSSGPTMPVGFRYLDKTRRHFRLRAYSPTFGAPRIVTARESNTVRTWVVHSCKQPARRQICKSSTFHARLLRARLIRVAYRPVSRGGGWGRFHRVVRNQLLAKVAP